VRSGFVYGTGGSPKTTLSSIWRSGKSVDRQARLSCRSNRTCRMTARRSRRACAPGCRNGSPAPARQRTTDRSRRAGRYRSGCRRWRLARFCRLIVLAGCLAWVDLHGRGLVGDGEAADQRHRSASLTPESAKTWRHVDATSFTSVTILAASSAFRKKRPHCDSRRYDPPARMRRSARPAAAGINRLSWRCRDVDASSRATS